MIRAASLAAALALPFGAARATSPALLYWSHAVIWTVPATRAGGELWLDPDGRYTDFVDSGAAAQPRGAAGPFRYQARHGAYQVTAAPDGVRLCLRPDPGPPPADTLFGAEGCSILPVRPIGEVFALVAGGQTYRLVLVQGR